MKINFTITATIRPKILDKTLSSFNKHLKDINMQESEIFANIDPMPNELINQKQSTAEVLSRYFKKTHLRMPDNANFAAAVKWLWSQPSTPYIFHLEDDWVLTEDISINSLLEVFSKFPNLYQIRLCKFLKKSAIKLYGLSPCLIKNDFYSKVAENMNEIINPEWQLRDAVKLGVMPPKYESTVCEYPKGKVVIQDIGRDWRQKNHMSKQEKYSEFVKWEWKKKVIY